MAHMLQSRHEQKWLRLNSMEEFLQFQQGRITRSAFPLGGFIYTTRTTPDNGKTLYSGNSFADARAAVPRRREAADLQGAHRMSTELCDDCPPIGYPTDKTRCLECPRKRRKIEKKNA